MAILKRLMDHPKLSFVFSIGSSGRKLENMQAAYTNFFKQALYRKISFLEEYDARDLIVRPVEGVVTYSNEAVRRIHEITSGHPYFVQLVCHELFSECQKNDKWQIDINDVENILEAVVERGTVNLKFVWDEASDLEKWMLAGLATDSEIMSLSKLETHLKREQVRFTRQHLERSLVRLKEKDVLTENNDFVIHLLRLWLMRNRSMDQVREELEDVNPIVRRLLEIGQEYHDKGEFERSVKNFEEALEEEPDNLETHLLLGISQLARGDYGKAIVEFETVLDIKLDDVVAQKGYCDAYLSMGDEYKSDGKHGEAEFAYQQVLKVNSQHEQAKLRMAELHHSKAVVAIVGGQDIALAEIEKALEYAEKEAFRRVQLELKAFMAGDRKFSDMLLVWGEQAKEMELWDEAGDLLAKYQREGGKDKSVKGAIDEIREHIKKRRQEELHRRATRLKNLHRFNEAIETWNNYLLVTPEKAKEVKQKIAELQEQAKAAAKKKGVNPILRAVLVGFVVLLIGSVIYLLSQPTSPLMVALAGPTNTPTATIPAPTATNTPTPTLTPTNTPTLTPTLEPTSIPLSWSRISSAQFLPRDVVNQIIFDPNDPEIIFVGTLNSGIYKTINGGITWQPAQLGLGGSNINSLIINPDNSNILYTGVIDDGAYKSVDGGLNWNKMSILPPGTGLWQHTSQIVLDPNDPDTIYFCDGFLIYQSTDSGKNWNEYGWAIASPIAELTIGPDGIVYFTEERGDNWIDRINPDTHDTDIFMPRLNAGDVGNFVSFDYTSGMIFIGDENDLYFSADDGETWQSNGLNCRGVALDGKGNALCVGSNYYSNDGGVSWNQMSSRPNLVYNKIGAISPHDPDVIFMGGIWGLYKSTNRGESWEDITNGLGNGPGDLFIDPDENTILLHLDTNYVQGKFISKLNEYDFEEITEDWTGDEFGFYFDEDGRLFISPDKETGFQPNSLVVSGEIEGQNLYIQNGQYVIYITDDQGVYYLSRDWGENWESGRYSIYGNADHGIYSVFADPEYLNDLYSLAPNLLLSDDDGKTWTNCHDFLKTPNFGTWIPGGYNILSLHPEKQGHFFAATKSEGLLVSKSQSCEDLSIVSPRSGLDNLFIRSVLRHPEKPDTIYVGTANGFYISYNDGESWGKVNDGLLGALTIYSLAVDPNNPGAVYAATPYGIFQLEDK